MTALRGGLGLVGRTDVLVRCATSSRFRRADRLFYVPLCLVLAVLAAPSS